jgi:hypothetical protein
VLSVAAGYLNQGGYMDQGGYMTDPSAFVGDAGATFVDNSASQPVYNPATGQYMYTYTQPVTYDPAVYQQYAQPGYAEQYPQQMAPEQYQQQYQYQYPIQQPDGSYTYPDPSQWGGAQQ